MNTRTSDLRYRLLDGPARLEPLRVLDTRALDWGGWRVTFSVLGASHAVSLEREGARLTELLTCVPPAGTARALAEMAAEAPGELCAVAHGLICRARVSLFSLGSGAALHGDFECGNRLYVAFPVTEQACGGSLQRPARALEGCEEAVCGSFEEVGEFRAPLQGAGEVARRFPGAVPHVR